MTDFQDVTPRSLALQARPPRQDRIADVLEAGGAPAHRSAQVAAEIVALALGDAYQRAILGIAEEGDGEAFARQIDVAVSFGLNWRA